jgi:hypothetical protein
MDWWQRNKDFAIRVGAVVVGVLVALIVRGCVYPDDTARLESQIGGMQSEIGRAPVPDALSRKRMRNRLESIREATALEADTIGERRQGEALFRGLLTEILEQIGQNTPETVDEFTRLAASSPNACFSRIYDEVREYFRILSIEADVPIDAAVGFATPRFTEQEVVRALHTLGLASRMLKSAILDAGVESVEKITVRIGKSRGPAGETEIHKDLVEISVRTKPDSLFRWINEMNDPKRFVPIESFTIGDRRGAKANRHATTVLATFKLLAVRIDPAADEEEG